MPPQTKTPDFIPYNPSEPDFIPYEAPQAAGLPTPSLTEPYQRIAEQLLGGHSFSAIGQLGEQGARILAGLTHPGIPETQQAPWEPMLQVQPTQEQFQQHPRATALEQGLAGFTSPGVAAGSFLAPGMLSGSLGALAPAAFGAQFISGAAGSEYQSLKAKTPAEQKYYQTQAILQGSLGVLPGFTRGKEKSRGFILGLAPMTDPRRLLPSGVEPSPLETELTAREAQASPEQKPIATMTKVMEQQLNQREAQAKAQEIPPMVAPAAKAAEIPRDIKPITSRAKQAAQARALKAVVEAKRAGIRPEELTGMLAPRGAKMPAEAAPKPAVPTIPTPELSDEEYRQQQIKAGKMLAMPGEPGGPPVPWTEEEPETPTPGKLPSEEALESGKLAELEAKYAAKPAAPITPSVTIPEGLSAFHADELERQLKGQPIEAQQLAVDTASKELAKGSKSERALSAALTTLKRLATEEGTLTIGKKPRAIEEPLKAKDWRDVPTIVSRAKELGIPSYPATPDMLRLKKPLAAVISPDGMHVLETRFSDISPQSGHEDVINYLAQGTSEREKISDPLPQARDAGWIRYVAPRNFELKGEISNSAFETMEYLGNTTAFPQTAYNFDWITPKGEKASFSIEPEKYQDKPLKEAFQEAYAKQKLLGKLGKGKDFYSGLDPEFLGRNVDKVTDWVLDRLGVKEKTPKAKAAVASSIPVFKTPAERLEYNQELFDGVINPETIKTPEDVRNSLTQLKELIAKNVDPRVTKPLSLEMARQLGREVGMTEEDILALSPGQALNAEEIMAARGLVNATLSRAIRWARRARNKPKALPKFLEALARYQLVDDQVRVVVAKEAGRALGAFRGEGSTMSDVVKALSKLSGKAKAEAAKRLIQIDPEHPGQISRLISEITPSSTMDKIHEAWLEGLLSGGAIFKKTIGDTTMLLKAPLEQLLGGNFRGAWAMPRGWISGTGATEGWPLLHGWAAGITEAIDNASYAFKYEISESKSEFEQTKGGAIHGAIKGELGRKVRIPTRALGAITEFYRTLNYNGAIHSMAYVRAAKESLEGEALTARAAAIAAKATDAMKDRAYKFSQRQTFQEPVGKGLIGRVTRAAQTHPVGRFVVPFVRTPLALAKENIRFSPLGVFEAAAKGSKGVAVKSILGSAATIWALHKASQGYLSGNGPASRDDRLRLEAQGWQPFSVRIGNNWVSYRYWEPIAPVLAAAANYAEWRKENPDARIPDAITAQFSASIAAIAETLPFATALTNLADVLRGSTGGSLSSMKRFGRRQLGTVIPTGVANIAHAIDRTIRVPQDIKQELESRIPGLTSRVPPLMAPAGAGQPRQPIMRPRSALGGFNPFAVAPAQPGLAAVQKSIARGEARRAVTKAARARAKQRQQQQDIESVGESRGE